ncbi:MAG: hypothetical protein ACRC62_11115, partial [Microcoleus sp.]
LSSLGAGKMIYADFSGCVLEQKRICNLEGLATSTWLQNKPRFFVLEEFEGMGDHVRWWGKNDLPFSITMEPYPSRATDEAMQALNKKCEAIGLIITVGDQSEWNPDCKWIEIKRFNK